MKYTLIFAVTAVLLGLYLVFGHNGVVKYLQMLSVRSSYNAQMKEVNKKINDMQRELNLIKRDKDYFEFVVRRELGLQKEGEELYIYDNEKR